MQTLKPKVARLNTSVGSTISATTRMTGGNLQRRNRRMFMRNPACVMCEAQGRVSEATQWDHIVPLCEGGGEHEGNVQGLCLTCHQSKTRLEAQRRYTY